MLYDLGGSEWRATLFNNTSSNFAVVSGSPLHSSILTKSFTIVNKLKTDESTKSYNNIVLRRQILFQLSEELSGGPVVTDLDEVDPQLSPGRVRLIP